MAVSSTAGAAFIGPSAVLAAAANEEEEEINLFGEDEEEDTEAERVAAYNETQANKPKTIAKVRSFFLLL